jgi:sialic acid synthase
MAAHAAGVDAVKFCKRHIPSELTQAAREAPYNGPQSFGATYGEHREALELSVNDLNHLQGRMAMNGWGEAMFATACDMQSVDDVEAAIDPPFYKVASRDLDNIPLIDYLARLGKPIVLSAGMAGDDSLRLAIECIRQQHDQIIVLQCTSNYPTANKDVGLRRLEEIRTTYDVLTGLSDHTPGIVMAQAAAARGAVMVEKHITLARGMKGTDHACSLEPEGINRLVRNIRAVEEAMQASVPDVSEARTKLARSLVTTREVTKGATITEGDLCLKSPGTGFKWSDRGDVIGRVAKNTIPADVTIQGDDLE